jgi:signal transduction histidine kinase
VSRAGLFLSRYGLDLLIGAAAVEAAVGTATKEELAGSGVLRWLEVGAATAVVLLLLGRRRFPFAAPATVWLASAALSFLDGNLIVNEAGLFVAGMGAAVLLGNQRAARQAYLGLIVVLAGAVVVVVNGPGELRGELVTIPVLFGIGWLVGFALRERTERTEAAEERARRAEREREVAARMAVAEERGRIARELHDVVAHAVSVIVLQVGAVRHRMPPEATEDREALRNVEEAGRTALAEMRRLLNAMREDGEHAELAPHPGLDDLDRLVHDVGAAGLEVDLRVRGDPGPLGPGLGLSAYRILQEGLTNSLKHSGADRAVVTVDYRPTELVLEVRDHGPAPGTTPGAGLNGTYDGAHGGRSGAGSGGGHGLVGIRERVKIFGGELTAGPAPGGGFLVRARLPRGGDAS